ncbi:GNAT family N-acetyltransferase [Myceligenerans pegani]|uniref:GNAT family N-acetyltransferase n=1 Tax=Myceligenerans pegani TaxID=2776917 RepID=A0ABR9N4V3_9MICO|nr:GNAT family N-acetyltransferase [Myceligenerans sp. TRM 65318]MBE1878017.1 GNAT family N-acetyltransferase [Myceligenerans sp. TRM 65318]MBE3020288.1 GNAT family N-acetyltransferase [Myceligenerans sp. TRM 65318]
MSVAAPASPLLRPATASDVPALVELNNAAIPAVPVTPADEMEGLLDISSLALVATDGDSADPLGFLLALDPGAEYSSENYDWFEDRGLDHLYVDRIVLGERARNRGIGRRLYDAVFDAAREAERDVVTCEINLDPPNPGSMRFHGRLGFEQTGEQLTKGGEVLVAKMAAQVPDRV